MLQWYKKKNLSNPQVPHKQVTKKKTQKQNQKARIKWTTRQKNLSPPPFRKYKLFFMVNENKDFLKKAINASKLAREFEEDK